MSKEENTCFRWPLIGHSRIIDFLQNNLNNGRISHAYLFIGPENIGKSAVANFLVGSLVCRHLNDQTKVVPCGQCECCRQLINKVHPDVFWISREMGETGKLKKNIGIEQIRQLQDKLNLHSFLNTHKVAVIEQAQNLSLEAANSLLKTLEEPTPNTVIILLADNLFGLPATIASRCQVVKFLSVSQEEIIKGLTDLGCDKKKAKKFAALSFGRPGLAFNYFSDPVSYETYKDKIANILELFKADIGSRFKIIGKITDLSDTTAIKDEISIWKRLLRDVAIADLTENQVSNFTFINELKELSVRLGKEKVIKLINEIDQAKKFLDANANARLTLENLVLNF